jgi:hypothetical protein
MRRQYYDTSKGGMEDTLPDAQAKFKSAYEVIASTGYGSI